MTRFSVSIEILFVEKFYIFGKTTILELFRDAVFRMTENSLRKIRPTLYFVYRVYCDVEIVGYLILENY